MLNLAKRIETIQALVDVGTTASLTYAALECRLTIEYLCYERLKITHDFLSDADLKEWTPGQVVKRVAEDANELVASEFTLRISTTPVPDNTEFTLAVAESMTYVDVGKQAALNIKALTRLWNALSNSALHVRVPKLKSDQLEIYGDAITIEAKVRSTMAELEKLKVGTLLSTSFQGGQVTIDCECGLPVKRNRALLKDGQIVSCIGLNCHESYIVRLEEGDAFFTRRTLVVSCPYCKGTQESPSRKFDGLRVNSNMLVPCVHCARDIDIRPMLMAGPSQPPASS